MRLRPLAIRRADTRGRSCFSLRSSVFPSCSSPLRNILPLHPPVAGAAGKSFFVPESECSHNRLHFVTPTHAARVASPCVFRLSLVPVASPKHPAEYSTSRPLLRLPNPSPHRNAESAAATCIPSRSAPAAELASPCVIRLSLMPAAAPEKRCRRMHGNSFLRHDTRHKIFYTRLIWLNVQYAQPFCNYPACFRFCRCFYFLFFCAAPDGRFRYVWL